MPGDKGSIAAKSLWTMGTYVASAGIRFLSSIVLSQLLGPTVLGVVVIAQAARVGTDLLTDLGFEQNVVSSPHGDDPSFLNTVWTMQIVRGMLISLAFAGFAPLLAHAYGIDVAVMLAMSAAPFLSSLASTSIYSLSRRMDVRTRNLFELTTEITGLALNVFFAVALKNVWAPILGILLSLCARSAFSYALPHVRHRLSFHKAHAVAILHFSKWIMLSSLALYAAIYIDRLYLGLVVPLAMLGVYGLAKTVSDLPQTVAGRLAFQIVFPFIARNRESFDQASRRDLVRTRGHFLALVMLGIGTVMAWSDWAIHILYGRRYEEAGWMLCLLLAGSWIGVLASLNEATVFGHGRPQFVSLANMVRSIVIAIALPTGFALGGLPGALMALPAGEVSRYLLLLRTQRRLGMTFLRQDGAFSLGLLGLAGAWIAIRLALGLGVPWALMG